MLRTTRLSWGERERVASVMVSLGANLEKLLCFDEQRIKSGFRRQSSFVTKQRKCRIFTKGYEQFLRGHEARAKPDWGLAAGSGRVAPGQSTGVRAPREP